VYSWCRWSDDLADEVGDSHERLSLLEWWESLLERCYQGDVEHPVYVALLGTVREFDIPRAVFEKLLMAFGRDQEQTRYETYADLLSYCECSANPVGELVLRMGRCWNARTAPLSDALCTGLQLANHWQDVERDYQQGRVYLPQEDLRMYGVREGMLGDATAGTEVRRLIEMEVGRAEALLESSWPLVGLVARELRLDVELFLRGGLAVCEAIRRQKYDVLARRPTIIKWQKLGLFGAAWLGSKWRRGQAT
jgi:squalene synthase HpnC